MRTFATVATGMTEYEVMDVLRLAPFSTPDTWRKRTAELRRQSRDAEAVIVETEHAIRFADETAAALERLGDILELSTVHIFDKEER